MARIRINERDQLPVTIALTVKNTGAPATPTTLRWRLDCVTTRTEVLNWAGLGAASTVQVTIPSSANAIINNGHATETMKLTVQANYGTDQQINGYYEYDIINNAFYV